MTQASQADLHFINRPMSIALDGVRGVAALLVLVGHCLQQQLYTGWHPFNPAMQHNAVVVFFVLSGLVIANSVYVRKTGLADYAMARFVRVMPVAVFSIVFSLVAFLIGQSLDLETIAHGVRKGTLSWQGVVLPLMFLSESDFGAGPVWNPPYWSLVYEVWYYALFAAAVFIRGWKRWAVLAIMVLLAGFKVLLMLPVWLTGVALARYAPARPLHPALALACCTIGLLALPLTNHYSMTVIREVVAFTGVPMGEFGFSALFASDIVFGLGMALFFLGLRPIADGRAALLERLKKPISWLAECSFTLYLIHWPILNLLHGLGVRTGDNPLLFVLLLAAIVALAGQIAKLTEHRRGDLRRWLALRLGQAHGAGGKAAGSKSGG